MKDFYTRNGRAKLMIFRSGAINSLPNKKELKDYFSAQSVIFYKSWGRHSLLIEDLIEYQAIARGETLSDEDRQDVNNGVFAFFDTSATLSSFSVLKYSQKVLLYADVKYTDYQMAKGLTITINELERGKNSINQFCSSMSALAATVTKKGLIDDVLWFDTEDFIGRYGSVGDRSISMMRQQLRTQYEKFRWADDSTSLVGSGEESVNDEGRFRGAA